MAFISEIDFRGGGGVASGEFVEIALRPGEDPADFVVSAYDENGNLYPQSGLAGGEVSLADFTGTPDPENPNNTIYVIPVGIRNANSDTNEGSGIALTDISAGGGVVDFYSAATLSPITAVDGAAAGATSSNLLEHRLLSGQESYQWDLDGNLIFANATPGNADLCITDQTLIRTQGGVVSGKDLRIGDMVWTLDHEYQPIRWIGTMTCLKDELISQPKRCPVRIRRDALGAGLPSTDLVVSPQHRILARSKIVERMFGQAEVLVPAIKLTPLEGIDQVQPADGITYIHLLFDQHQIVEADGSLVESLLMAPRSSVVVETGDFGSPELASVPEELLELSREPARPLVDRKRAKALVQRMIKNDKPFCDLTIRQSVESTKVA